MISDRAIAADLWQRAEANGKAGYAYPSGLRVAVYINNGTRTVRYGRLDKYPSLLETTFLNQAFGAPETAEFRAYQTDKVSGVRIYLDRLSITQEETPNDRLPNPRTP